MPPKTYPIAKFETINDSFSWRIKSIASEGSPEDAILKQNMRRIF